MAYTALEKMRRINEKRFGRDVGPMQPGLFDGAEDGFDLKSAALRFLHERCEDLRFDRLIEAAKYVHKSEGKIDILDEVNELRETRRIFLRRYLAGKEMK